MSPLKIKIKRDNRAVLICISGELDIASAPLLTERATRALRDPVDRLELELTGLTFVDCAGARTLGVLRKLVPPGSRVTMRGAGRRVRKVLAIVEAPLEPDAGLEPDDGRGPAKVPESADLQARQRTRWLALESQVLVCWAEQACADSRDVIARARAARAESASHRSLAGRAD
jgi:anti-anti-sigma factor